MASGRDLVREWLFEYACRHHMPGVLHGESNFRTSEFQHIVLWLMIWLSVVQFRIGAVFELHQRILFSESFTILFWD